MSLLFEGMLNAAQSARHPTLEVEIPSDDVEMVELFTSLGFLKLRAMAPIKSQVYKLSLRAEIPFRPLESYRLTRTKLSLGQTLLAVSRRTALSLRSTARCLPRSVARERKSLKERRRFEAGCETVGFRRRSKDRHRAH